MSKKQERLRSELLSEDKITNHLVFLTGGGSIYRIKNPSPEIHILTIFSEMDLVVQQRLFGKIQTRSFNRTECLIETLDYLNIKVTLILGLTPTAEPQRPPTCGPTQATCSNGQCITRDRVCDGNYDCNDRSDELNCRKIFLGFAQPHRPVQILSKNCTSIY
jgi:hypothetical protein